MTDARVDGIEVIECQACPELCGSRSRIVNGVGPEDADLLFVGEAPGRQEDEVGEPFVGRSGDVLDGTLRDCGLDRSDVRITNCVRCRPPENRDPTTQERDNCAGHLDREIAGIDPAVIVALGKVPSERLLDRSVGVTSEAGSVYETRLAGELRRVVVSVHPAATLYDPPQEETFDRAVGEAVDLAGGGGGDQSRLGEF